MKFDVVVRCERPKCVKNATHEVVTPFGYLEVCEGHAALLTGDRMSRTLSTSREMWEAEREWVMAACRYGPAGGPARRGWLSAVQYVGGIDRFRELKVPE